MKEEGGGERVREVGWGWGGGGRRTYIQGYSVTNIAIVIKAGSDVRPLCRFAGSSGQGLL